MSYYFERDFLYNSTFIGKLLAFTGRTFRATETMAAMLRDVLQKQFPDQGFSFVLLPYHERNAIFYYQIHIESENCPSEVAEFIDEYISRLFPDKR